MPRPLLLAALALFATAAHAQTLTAYPNPHTDGPLTVVSDAPDAAFELYDVLGRAVDHRQPLAPGAYLWRLRHPDGSASTARPLTLASRGPLDVRLVTAAAPSASAPRRPDPAHAKATGCTPSPGSVFFDGFLLAPGESVLTRGATVTVASTSAAPARFSACVPDAGGVSIGFPGGASPAVWTGGATATPAEVRVGGAVEQTEGPQPFSAAFTLTAGETGLVVSGGLSPDLPRLLDVLAYDADGTPTVVATRQIPAGTPTSSIFRTIPEGVTAVGLAGVSAAGWRRASGGALRDSVLTVQFDFRTPNGSSPTVQLPDGSSFSADAVSLSTPTGGPTTLGLFSTSGMGTEFEVGGLSFGSTASGSPNVLHASLPPTSVPAWLQMLDGNGFYAKANNAAGVRITCGEGAVCETFGATATPFSSTAGGSPNVLTAGPGGEPLLGLPDPEEFRAGPFESTPGHGLLTDRGDLFETTATYRDESGDVHTATVTFGKPRANKTSLSVTGLTPETGGVPFDGYELRYIRNGQVRLSKTLPTDRTATFKARLEITGFASTASGSPNVLTAKGPTDGPVLRFAVSFNGGEEFVEIRPILNGPPVSSYLTITMTNLTPWTLGFASSAGGSPNVLTAPLAEGAAEDWGFEIE